MFTGIIECTGSVELITRQGTNVTFTIASAISTELKVDQSIAHNGVCLTVESLGLGNHTVTAIAETLQKSNLGNLKEGKEVNLERCLKMDGRLDGHMVQGHVDSVGNLLEVQELDGSFQLTFSYKPEFAHLLVEKGSVCINGVSLTVFNVSNLQFSVAIIPYTWQHTNLSQLAIGQTVNLEFDILGKYVARLKEVKGL